MSVSKRPLRRRHAWVLSWEKRVNKNTNLKIWHDIFSIALSFNGPIVYLFQAGRCHTSLKTFHANPSGPFLIILLRIRQKNKHNTTKKKTHTNTHWIRKNKYNRNSSQCVYDFILSILSIRNHGIQWHSIQSWAATQSEPMWDKVALRPKWHVYIIIAYIKKVAPLSSTRREKTANRCSDGLLRIHVLVYTN